MENTNQPTNPFEEFKKTLSEEKKAEFQAFRDYYKKTYQEVQADVKAKKNNRLAFILKLTPEEAIALWRRAQRWHMNLDGTNCWFDGRSGIFFNYIAMKQAVQSIYPKSRFDVQIVLKNDKFTCGRTQEGVTYNFEKADPFEDLNFHINPKQTPYKIDDDTNFKGAFGVFVANDGTGTEVLELLTPKDLQEIVQTSRNIYQWNTWAGEYIMKTVFKRVCKRVREDDRDFQDMIDFDNAVNGNDFQNGTEPKQMNDTEIEAILHSTAIDEINKEQ